MFPGVLPNRLAKSRFHSFIAVLFAGDDGLVSRSLMYQAGETANLPCDISVPASDGGRRGQQAPNDELMLIMWYREDVRSPIYSIGNVS